MDFTEILAQLIEAKTDLTVERLEATAGGIQQHSNCHGKTAKWIYIPNTPVPAGCWC